MKLRVAINNGGQKFDCGILRWACSVIIFFRGGTVVIGMVLPFVVRGLPLRVATISILISWHRVMGDADINIGW